MAKTTAPKATAKSSAASKGKSKRTERPAANAGVTTTAVHQAFPLAAGAFTVEQPPDPVLSARVTRSRRFRTSSKSRI